MSETAVEEEPKWRYGLPGYFSGAELPQSGPIRDIAFGVGWPELDEIFRFYPSEFVVVTGRPGCGKSTFMFNCLVQLAKNHGIASFCHIPENERHIVEKLRRIWSDDDSFDHFLANQIFFQSAQPEHYGSEVRELTWVLDRACDAIQRDKVEIILLDPWNQIERAKPREMPLTDYIGDCLKYLTQFCRAMNAIVVMVAHPTKPTNGGGTLYDIEGSAHWYNRCDAGLYLTRDPDMPRCQVMVQKVREEPDAGRKGYCFFQVNSRTGVFTPEYGSTSLAGG